MKTISRDELRAKIDAGADFALLEVLGPETFAEWHLPGAKNVPADDSFKDKIGDVVPDKNAEVVVYCKDLACQASNRALAWMEELGYTNVSDYSEGKLGWKGAGLPVEQ